VNELLCPVRNSHFSSCACVRKREGVRVCVCLCVREVLCAGECVCVCQREMENVSLCPVCISCFPSCMCLRERVWVDKRVHQRERGCVQVRVYVSEREIWRECLYAPFLQLCVCV